MAQQYIAQFQSVGLQVQTQLQHSSPDIRRDVRTAPTGALQYGAIQAAVQQPGMSANAAAAAAPATAPVGASPAVAAGVYPSPAYQSPQSHTRSVLSQPHRFSISAAAAAAASSSKPLVQSSLPRLTTNEAQVQAGAPLLGSDPAQAIAQASERASPSPSGISFHHWQPPITNNPSGKESHKTSPQSRVALSSTEHAPSPRKRKAVGGHQPAPPPTSTHPASPSLSVTSSAGRGHVRRRSSIASVRGFRQYTSPHQNREPAGGASPREPRKASPPRAPASETKLGADS